MKKLLFSKLAFTLSAITFLLFSCNVQDDFLKNEDALISSSNLVSSEFNDFKQSAIEIALDNSPNTKDGEKALECCDCKFWVKSTHASEDFNVAANWIAQIYYKGCNGEEIFQAGFSSNVNNQYNTSDIGTWKSYDFEADNDAYGNPYTDMELRTFIPMGYASVTPITVNTKVICSKKVTSPGQVLTLDLTCNSLGSGSGQGCADNMESPVYRLQEGYLNDCTAYKERPRE